MHQNCTLCGVPKTDDQFYRGHRQCKDCIRAKARQWYRNNTARASANAARWRAKNPERMIELSHRWQAANPARMRVIACAVTTVQRALKRGDLVRGTSCQMCGASGVKIEASHDDYSRPLEVRWLCVPCHRRADHAMPKTL